MDLGRSPTGGGSPLNVGIFFPSGPPKPGKLERALESVKDWPRTFHCPYAETERSREAPSYLADADTARVEELTAMLTDPTLPVLWAGRGGFGATRMLPHLARRLDGVEPLPKRLLGYSDITALFALFQTLGRPIQCLHGPVFLETPDHPRPELLQEALEGRLHPLPVDPEDWPEELDRVRLRGGNLAVLASLAGTPYLPSFEGRAMLLEDIDEAPYRLDRYLTQLHQTGAMEGCCGILFGTFTNCGAAELVRDTLRERCRELGVPLLGWLEVGHQPRNDIVQLDSPYLYDADLRQLAPQGLGG